MSDTDNSSDDGYEAARLANEHDCKDITFEIDCLSMQSSVELEQAISTHFTSGGKVVTSRIAGRNAVLKFTVQLRPGDEDDACRVLAQRGWGFLQVCEHTIGHPLRLTVFPFYLMWQRPDSNTDDEKLVSVVRLRVDCVS
jgi:hypothetical protein